MNLVVLIAIIISFVANVFAVKDFYFITSPNLLISETLHHFNVHTSTDIILTIESIHTPSQIKHQSSKFVIKKGFDKIPYYVPFVGSHVGSKIKLIILGDVCQSGAKCESMKIITGTFINETREIGLLDKNFIIFAETDKPIYKPGDKVQLRFMAIYPTNLMREPDEIGEQIEIILDKNNKFVSKRVKDYKDSTNFELIIIENPENVRVAQWKNVSINDAMNLEYQLNKDPIFGIWKAKAVFDGQEEFVQFEIKKYVLPRFIVEVIPPTEILAKDESVSFKVCSKYSTGKLMNAKINGIFCMLYSYRMKKCVAFKSDLLKQGCNKIKLDSKTVFNLASTFRYSKSKSQINVTVTENGTSSSVSKVAEGPGIMYNSFIMKFDGRPYYKPGLPYFGRINLVRHNKKPAKMVNISISIRSWSYGKNWGFSRNYTSNKKGVIDFVIPYIPLEQSLSIHMSEVSDNLKLPMNPATLYQSLTNFQSKDGHYLQFMPITETFKCPGKLNLILLTNYDIASTSMYIQIFSRGQIVKMIEYPPVPVKCYPRDDFFGHYQCVNGTTLTCLSGWKGGNCREPICDGDCLNGACVEPNKCICKQYWTGKSCNQCIKANYCQNGYCVNGADCECYPGWMNFDCSKKGPIKHSYRNVTTMKPITRNETEIKKFEKQTIFERIISIPLLKKMGPDVHVIAYFINANNEVVADAIEIASGLNNCSQLGGGKFKFNKKTAMPKSKVVLTVDPGVKENGCAVRIADEALLQFGQSSNVDLAYLVQKLIKLNHKITVDQRIGFFRKPICIPQTRVKRMIMPFYGSGYDSRKVLSTAGFTAITNTRIVNVKCMQFLARGMPNRAYIEDAAIPFKKSISKVLDAKIKKQIREFFPESWVFSYFNKTKKQLNLTVPDSMTTWRADAYCMTEKGLWIAPTRKLKVILPFYSNIYVPYSMKLNEVLRLPVKVFNYAGTCFEINVQINVDANEIDVIGLKAFTLCQCKNDEKTVYFNLKPKIIGKLNITIDSSSRYSSFCSENKKKKINIAMSDSVRRQILVEPPGVPTETTFSELICNKNEQLGILSVFTIPSEIVSGSLRSYLTFNGDVMGKTFDNLDKLVVMPYGCGEQNMVAVVPSIYVLDYLNSLKIDNPALMAKAKGYIVDGYTRQLIYKHDDGSFSAFGKTDKFGSTWLTAFVLKSFQAASKYVNINLKTLKEATKYLERMQRSNGCFEEKGKLFSSTMAGGIKRNDKTDENLLTAYVLISLNGVDLTNTSINIKKAINCAKENITNNPSNYRLALTAYSLSLNNLSPSLTKSVIDQLLEQPVSFGRYKYWPFDKESSDEQKSNSADIETTGYAILALINHQDLSESLKTVYWLSNQRNSLGGYYSTQDTVVALNALAVFAKTIGVSENVNLNVSIVLNRNKTYKGLITADNRLVSQTFNLGTENISYVSMKTNGSGCASIQLSSLYNIHKLYAANDTFKLSVKTEIESVEQCNIRNIKVCFAYLRRDKNSNMILVMINYPSGWELSEEERKSLSLQISTPLNRIDFQKTRMELYYDAFSYSDAGKDSCFRFKLEERTKISNLQPALVKIVDYYNPEVYSEKSYSMFNKACNMTDGKEPSRPEVLLCPICVNDSINSTLKFIRTICSAWFNGFVTANSNGSQMRTVFVAEQSLFYEWNLELGPKNCSCLSKWGNFNKRFVILSSRWKSLNEKLTLSNDSVMFPVATLYSAYQFGLQGQCNIANNFYLMLNRLIPDFANKTTTNDSCPKCIMRNNYYFIIKNVTEWYCANYTDWKLNISSISPIVKGVLNSNVSSIPVEIEFPHQFCYCYEHVRDTKRSFRIIDLNRKLQSLNQKSKDPIKLVLNKGFEVIDEEIFSYLKNIKCA